MFGWKGDSLQRALNARCNNDQCSELISQSAEESERCTLLQVMKEDVGDDDCKTLTLLLEDL